MQSNNDKVDDVVKKQAVELLKDIYSPVEPRVASKEIIKPKNWSSRANAPYFRERYALAFKQVLDAMLREAEEEVFEDRMYCMEDFPEKGLNSLYLMVNQSSLYLLEYLDFDGKYKSFLQRLIITKVRGRGVRIAWDRNFNSDKLLSPKVIVGHNGETETVSDIIDKFLHDAQPGEQLSLDKISLSDEEIEVISAGLVTLPNIIFRVKPHEVFLKKLTDEQQARMGL